VTTVPNQPPTSTHVLQFSKGKLAGVQLREITESELRALSQSANRTAIAGVSYYKGTLKRAVFQGIQFSESNFARVQFENVAFSRCEFRKVDFTRAAFKDCSFSDCRFINCDPYYVSFERTEIDPSVFKDCFTSHDEWNKALILFSNLQVQLRAAGETRFSRIAEYYFRIWQRRRLFHRWKFKRIAGFGSWFWSLCIAAFTGYGERPIYLAGWAFVVITAMSEIYMRWMPYAITGPNHRFVEYWYYSFKMFFAQGFSREFQSVQLSAAQMSEFVLGLVMVALLIGSVARKLSP
jgi:Pentapeptide repeats (9 copies)